MKYTIEKIQTDFNKGNKLKYIFFWGHKPSSDKSITKSCLSQWWKVNFTIDDITYCCMEQYMMAEKARLFKDDEMLREILNSSNPKTIKAFGRAVRNFDNELWEKNRCEIIVRGNYAKFSQNDGLKIFLMNTKDRIIAEASPYDKIWGIGMKAEDENIENPLLWKGKNLLGFALMEVRDKL